MNTLIFQSFYESCNVGVVSRAPKATSFTLPTIFWRSPVVVIDLVPSSTVPAATSMVLWLKLLLRKPGGLGN